MAVDIGTRPNGSPGNHAAADYIQAVYRGCGLEVELQPFSCPDWQVHHTEVLLEETSLLAAANAFSPACEVAAPTVAAGTLAELESASIEGRIVILYGDLTRAPLSPKSWFLKDEREDRIIALLEQRRPAAILTVQTRAGKLERLIEDWEFAIPSATVPARDGLRLLQSLGATVKLRIASERTPGNAANVVGRLPGKRAEQIVLCAHYDTKIDTPGAGDNAGGVAVLLTLAQMLSQRAPERTLEFVAFTGEEYLPIGDDEYVRRRGETFAQITLAMNFDGLGQMLSANSIASFNCAPTLEQALHELTNAYPGVVWVEPWPQSNHSTFTRRGVPALAFTRQGGFANEHLRSDTIEWISSERLTEVTSLAQTIVQRFDSFAASRRPSESP